MTSSDVSLIERLRKENLDQFFTLVRMHLSFVVDINTDDVDCSTDKPKQFRWNFHKKTKNPSANSSQSNANSTKNNTEVNSITEDGILRLNELIDFLSKPDNVTQEGIFRRTGSLSRQQELRQLLITGSSLGLDEGKFSVHDCASVLKGFLADLPQPLLMDQYYQTYCTLAAQYPPNVESSESKLLTALQLLLLLLAPPHRSFLKRLLTLLRLVADNETSNRMSPDTLATMFTPHLLCPRKLSPESFRTESVAASPVVSFMIRRAARLFEPPPPLATDAAAYLALRERRRALSPHADLDESISDKAAARTVYTFVDRGRTRAENAANPTDAALAQLYAHIQALPDSGHKRRLVKHFNRQNGYGTPIQIHRTGKVAGSRSFGDSIKRHIFNKGLLNKTPKKGSASTINTIEEKTGKGKSQVDVCHKSIVLKNMANKIANSQAVEDSDECDSDGSTESTLSEGGLGQSRRLSPKFVSEPNLSALDADGDTPKNSKKRATRLFRSKLAAAARSGNKKYRKRATGAPPCVPCAFAHDTVSDDDVSYPDTSATTPPKADGFDARMHYLTSTPGLAEAAFDVNATSSTPYAANLRRASMSPITKSTQKLSKAMQESIMTPRSRKPLIVTCEQRDSIPPAAAARARDRDRSAGADAGAGAEADAGAGADSVFHSMSISPHNDSDFVSSDDEMMSRSTFSCERSAQSTSGSIQRNRTPYDGRSLSVADVSPLRSESTRFIIGHERPNLLDVDLDIDVDVNVNVAVPKFKTSHEMTDLFEQKPRSLSEPFRDYLLSRSVLTATPVDLSMLNTTADYDERITDSLLFCLDGHVPADLAAPDDGQVVDGQVVVTTATTADRSPLKSVNCDVGPASSPSRKRCRDPATSGTALKRIGVGKENVGSAGDHETPVRETDL